MKGHVLHDLVVAELLRPIILRAVKPARIVLRLELGLLTIYHCTLQALESWVSL
jgi:hypothetical protein